MDESDIDNYRAGATIGDIAAKHNVWPNQVTKFLKERGIQLRHRGHQKGHTPWNKGLTSNKKIDIIKWVESGTYKTLSEGHIRQRMRTYLLLTKGHKCEICNSTHWNGQLIPLVCDHIDGNSTNSDISNFRLVCPNCNAQLPTTGSRNKGRGRRYDRDYYYKKLERSVA